MEDTVLLSILFWV